MIVELEWPSEIDPQFSVQFLQGMLDRMAVSYFKYGPVTSESLEGRDTHATLELRWQRYLHDGNREWLMDVANFAMIEFMVPQHPLEHYKDTEGEESPGVVLKGGKISHEHYSKLG